MNNHNQTTKNIITISRKEIKKQGGVVILPLEEYKELCKRAVPTYYLEGKEAEELDKLVEEGLKDCKEGRCISASSVGEALRVYGKEKNRKH